MPRSRGDSQVLGVLDTNVSLAAMDVAVAQHERRAVAFTAAALLVVSLFTVWLIWLTVHKPVRKLTKATRAVAQAIWTISYPTPATTKSAAWPFPSIT